MNKHALRGLLAAIISLGLYGCASMSTDSAGGTSNGKSPSGNGGASTALGGRGGSSYLPGATGGRSMDYGGSSMGYGGSAASYGGKASEGGTGTAGGSSAQGGSSMAGASGGRAGAAGVGGAAGANAGPVAGSGGAPFSVDAGVSPDAGDKFVGVGTNPFVLASHDPFSTFAADVDTASYDIFRREAQLGQLPQPASVRLEEYVNYFSYDYPAPEPGAQVPFKISLAAASQVFDRGTTLLRVGIQASKAAALQKKPANLVFLLDVSGSMADSSKLPLAQKMMIAALDTLDATDTVAIVTYSTTAVVRLTPTAVSQRANIVTVINSLSAGGSTAGADGLGMAYAQALAGYIEGGINHIVMCTDGDFNVGPSSTTDLLNLIKEKRKTGVTLTALGFGSGNLNDAMMEAVAGAGNGIYSVITDESYAQKYVREKLLSTVVHVAKDMKIQVEFNPAKVYAYRLLGYEDRAIPDINFRNDIIDAGEVGAGHRVTALYEIVLAGGTIPLRSGAPVPLDGPPSTLTREVADTDLALVKVRYKQLDAVAETPASEVSKSLAPTAVLSSLEGADADMRWAAAVAGLAELLKGSPYADKTWLPTIRSIATAQASRDADRNQFALLLEKIAAKIQ
jgi:Ca-activated chloride channel family protein